MDNNDKKRGHAMAKWGGTLLGLVFWAMVGAWIAAHIQPDAWWARHVRSASQYLPEGYR